MKHPLSHCVAFPSQPSVEGGRPARDGTLAAGRPLLGAPELGRAGSMHSEYSERRTDK